MLRPHIEYFAKLTKDIFLRARDYSNSVSKQIDKVVVWIVGFATSGIVLIISQSDKLINYTHSNIVWIVCFLTVSLIAGIFGRVLYAISSYLSIKVIIRFEGRLLAIEFPYKPRTLVGNETAKQVLEYFKQDFDMDLPIIRDMAQFLEQKDIESYNESVRKYYNDFSEWSDKQLENSKKIMDEIMRDSFGFTDKQLNKYSQPAKIKPKMMIMTFWISAILYLISFTSFAVAGAIFSKVFISS